MASVEGININGTSIANCYRKFYPETYKQIQDFNLFHYLHLWGIRVSSCNSSTPDDLVGGLRVNNFNVLEAIASQASTEPSPYFITNPLSDAKKLGGAAFMVEGQNTYRYNGRKHSMWKPYPSFCPTKAVKVYRWSPSVEELKALNAAKKPISEGFEEAKKRGRVKISTSPDTCIHRAWSKDKFYKDSAGCQIIPDYDTLNIIGDWAEAHIKKKYGNIFVYTLFTKDQFVSANKGFDFVSIIKSVG